MWSIDIHVKAGVGRRSPGLVKVGLGWFRLRFSFRFTNRWQTLKILQTLKELTPIHNEEVYHLSIYLGIYLLLLKF